MTDQVVGWCAAALACALAILVLAPDPCGDGGQQIAILPAGFLFGLAAFVATARAGWHAALAVSAALAIALASGVGLFILSVVRWASECSR